jgi:hypothetical protein
MGLYLCVFDDNEDVDGIDVGAYADFNAVREVVTTELEDGQHGARFPTFILHSDCAGEWSYEECGVLKHELVEIIARLRERPPRPFPSEWQAQVAKSLGVKPTNACESFIDVDGEYLLQRLADLTDLALERRRPISFQ